MEDIIAINIYHKKGGPLNKNEMDVILSRPHTGLLLIRSALWGRGNAHGALLQNFACAHDWFPTSFYGEDETDFPQM